MMRLKIAAVAAFRQVSIRSFAMTFFNGFFDVPGMTKRMILFSPYSFFLLPHVVF